MTPVFGEVYAGAYDALYQDKDYAGECALIERLLQRYANGPIRSICDLGCGTGNHALPLAARGYEVVGVDRAPDMLAQARQKQAAMPTASIVFQQGDLRSLALRRTFDAVVMMFAVLGYQLEDADVLAALQTARRHLRPGGLFLYDVWYGPAVLHERPSPRSKTVPLPDGELIREVSAELDPPRRVCIVRYQVRCTERGRIVREAVEEHVMRFFFPDELTRWLTAAGLESVRLGAFPDVDHDPDEATWNVLGVARAMPQPSERR